MLALISKVFKKTSKPQN